MTAPIRPGRLSWRDGVSYLLAFGAWAALAVATYPALRALHATVAPLVVAAFIKNPVYENRLYRLGGQAGVADGVTLAFFGFLWLVYILLAEEYLRSPISAARERRAREAGARAPAAPAPATRWQDYGVPGLARRVLIAAIFPAGVFGLSLVAQGVLWLLLR